MKDIYIYMSLSEMKKQLAIKNFKKNSPMRAELGKENE